MVNVSLKMDEISLIADAIFYTNKARGRMWKIDALDLLKKLRKYAKKKSTKQYVLDVMGKLSSDLVVK